MRSIYLLSAEVKASDGRLLEYAVLEAKQGSTRLITPTMKGTALGGGSLALFVSIYSIALAIPFIFFGIPPITRWDGLSFATFIIGIPVGFFLILFQGFRLFRRIQARYPRVVRTVKILETRTVGFGHELLVQSDEERLVLTIKSSRKNLLGALALSER